MTQKLRTVGRDKALSFPAISDTMTMPATCLMQAYFEIHQRISWLMRCMTKALSITVEKTLVIASRDSDVAIFKITRTG